MARKTPRSIHKDTLIATVDYMSVLIQFILSNRPRAKDLHPLLAH